MSAEWPASITIRNAQGPSPFVLICEHASNWMPPDYGGLGLPLAALSRHIAWDIGALDLARHMAARLDATLVEAGASRLLIDLNRPTDCASSIPEMSEATVIPGNCGLAEAERQHRIETWFYPFQSGIARLLDTRLSANRASVIVAVHSFTPIFLGQARAMQAGILYRHSHRFGAALVEALSGAGRAIAHNQPYQIDDASDYTIPIHGERRGLDAVLLEIRQDLIATPGGVADWAERLCAALVASDPTQPPAATQ